MSFLLDNLESVPLIYPSIAFGQTQYTNVLLIDNQVPSYQTFVDSANSSTLPIVYSVMSSKTELLSLLQANFTNISRVAIVFTSSLGNNKMFLDCKLLFTDNEIEPYSENVQFLMDLIKYFQVRNLDFLSCDTLNYSNYVDYYNLLTDKTGVTIGASNDKTGNIKYGGDWIMESTSENIELVYFTQSIEYYQYLLDNPVLLQNFRVDYTNGVYILLTIDVNNYFNVVLFPPRTISVPWLYKFELYYSGSLQYTLPNLNGLYFASNTSYPFNSPTNLQSNPGIGFWTSDGNIGTNVLNTINIQSLSLNQIPLINVSFPPIICFLEGSKILTEKGYQPIEVLRKGDLVKTVKHGFVPINMIGKKEFYNPVNKEERIKDQLYKCSKDKFDELSEDLVITGCHSILVENSIHAVSLEQVEKIKEVNGDIYFTDDKLRLPACVDNRTTVYEKEGNHTIYHLALDHDDYYMNYGIYANGLLVESSSKWSLKENSNMILIE